MTLFAEGSTATESAPDSCPILCLTFFGLLVLIEGASGGVVFLFVGGGGVAGLRSLDKCVGVGMFSFALAYRFWGLPGCCHMFL